MHTFAPKPKSPGLDPPGPASLVPARHGRGGFDTKLPINDPGDAYEQEAGRVTEQVIGMPERPLRGDGASRGSGAGRLQTRQIGAGGLGQYAAPSIVREALDSPGQPLDGATRAFMEPRFGHDFSRVRVHSDAVSARSAKDIGAEAYTVGRDIVFGLGRFKPETHEGKRLLAHELTHTLEQGESPVAVQRKPEEGGQPKRELPSWVMATPKDALPGVPVPGYEVEREKYTWEDHARMLKALTERVLQNGDVLADFYDNLRKAWVDLVIDLGVQDAGLSFAAETVFTILTSLATAWLPAAWSLTVGVVSGTAVNVLGNAAAEKELDQRKKTLKEMMVAPSVKDVGASDARGQLAGLLLDNVAYATWLGATIDNPADLSKFRIPPKFPPVPEQVIRFQVAAAVLRYRSTALYEEHLRQVANDPGHIGGTGMISIEGILYIDIRQGSERDFSWAMKTDPALMKAISGHRVNELKSPKTNDNIPLAVEFVGNRPKDKSGEVPNVDEKPGVPPRVIFGRNTSGGITIYGGNFLGFYQLSRYCNPSEQPLTVPDIWGPGTYSIDPMLGSLSVFDSAHPNGVTPTPLPSTIEFLYQHYRESAECGVALLLQKFIDPTVLHPERGSHTSPDENRFPRP
jgi:hypothetical protein